MPLNSTLEEVTAAGEALASELGCVFRLYPYEGTSLVLKFIPGHGHAERPYLIFVFSLVFDSPSDVSPQRSNLYANKGLPVDTRHID